MVLFSYYYFHNSGVLLLWDLQFLKMVFSQVYLPLMSCQFTFPPYYFSRYFYVFTTSLEDNYLKTIPADAFSGLTQLKSFSLFLCITLDFLPVFVSISLIWILNLIPWHYSHPIVFQVFQVWNTLITCSPSVVTTRFLKFYPHKAKI